ncbi:MAG: hypothetical protein ACQKBY_09465 [Verrucomicrobiales bacterium]
MPNHHFIQATDFLKALILNLAPFFGTLTVWSNVELGSKLLLSAVNLAVASLSIVWLRSKIKNEKLNNQILTRQIEEQNPKKHTRS